jgi:hypothetical protein
MIELECGHWLDYGQWLEREKDHKIETRLQELEIAALKSKLQAVKSIVENIKPRSNLALLQQQQWMGLRAAAQQQSLGGAGLGSLGLAAYCGRGPW